MLLVQSCLEVSLVPLLPEVFQVLFDPEVPRDSSDFFGVVSDHARQSDHLRVRYCLVAYVALVDNQRTLLLSLHDC